MSYELTASAEVREAFENAVSQFTANLPFFYQEEIGNEQITQARRERIEEFQIYADRRNYKQRRTSTGIEVWVEMPERIRARNEAVLSPIAQEQQWASVACRPDGPSGEEVLVGAVARRTPTMIAAISCISAGAMPSVVTAGVPMRRPLACSS